MNPSVGTASPEVPVAPMHTRVTDLLGVRYPIVQGGMMWVGRAELASAVSNAGGLGVLTALTQPTPDDLRREIERCRRMTAAPFGVNLTMLPSRNPPPYEAYLEAALDSGVRIIETAGNSPKDFIQKAKAHGAKVIHKCTSVRHALTAERIGVDAVSIDGFECAGHPGEDGVGALVLFALAARKLTIPLIGSGGIADGRTMAAALAMGLDGVNMGTRFCVTQEAPIHPKIKQLLIDCSERDTQLIFRTLHNTARVLKTPVSEEVVAIESRPGGCEFADVQHLVSGLKGREALEQGDASMGLVWAGQTVGLIDDLPTCAELIERMVREAQRCLEHAVQRFER